MTDCESLQADLDSYRDRTLDETRHSEVEAHLSQCAACREQVRHAEAIERSVKETALSWTPPDGLWARIKDSAEANRLAAANRKRQLFFPGMAAALLLLLAGIQVFGLVDNDPVFDSDPVASALVNEFHTFVVSHRQLDYIDSRPGNIRNWFGDKVDFRVPLPVKAAEMNLAGGRLCNMFDQRIVSFMYQVDGVWISLYIMKPVAAESSKTAGREFLLRGYGYIDWQHQGLQYSLVGDVSAERLRRIAATLHATELSGRKLKLETSPVYELPDAVYDMERLT